jgi:hypothetical protein
MERSGYTGINRKSYRLQDTTLERQNLIVWKIQILNHNLDRAHSSNREPDHKKRTELTPHCFVNTTKES